MASPAPWELKVWMEERHIGLIHKCRRSFLGIGFFWHHAGPKGPGQTRALPHSQKCGSGGQSPSKCHSGSFHRTHLSLCQNRFPKFMWGPVYFSSFFLNHYCIKKCFSFGKGYRGASTVRSLLPSITTKTSEPELSPATSLIFNEGRLGFPPPYKK